MDTLVTRTLVDQAYAVILDAICDGVLKPGERLTQSDIAERLNVSRQPIHNALLVLKSQGFVCESGRRGLEVAPLDPQLFEDIFQFRSAVEPLAARLATLNVTAEAIGRGREILARGVKATRGEAGEAIRADMEFHSWIYDLSGNSLIVNTMHLNWQHLRRAMGEVLRYPALSKRVWTEHEAIVDAMEKRDPEAAAAMMQRHILQAYDHVRPGLSDRKKADLGRLLP